MASNGKRRNLTQIAYDTLKQRILDNQIRPGTMLSEKEMTEALHMSRTPVREAFKMLKSEGLLEIRDGVGTYVKPISRQDIEDAYEIRKTLEILAAQTSIYRFTQAELLSLQRKFEDLQKQLDQGLWVSIDEYMQADWLLHDLIIKKSKNQYVERVVSGISATLRRYQSMSIQEFSHAQQSIAEHLAILECIRGQDVSGLTALLQKHIQY